MEETKMKMGIDEFVEKVRKEAEARLGRKTEVLPDGKIS